MSIPERRGITIEDAAFRLGISVPDLMKTVLKLGIKLEKEGAATLVRPAAFERIESEIAAAESQPQRRTGRWLSDAMWTWMGSKLRANDPEVSDLVNRWAAAPNDVEGDRIHAEIEALFRSDQAKPRATR